eukprot:GHRR01029659.1.p1 GENE.GHRR01029659.1~~GHRR01029659.1.p1  ORF type:complete len:728 (+),score=322.72 GHRR01029659.1:391-2574(+)
MKKSHVKVFVRTRPTARVYEGLKIDKDGESITITFPKEESLGFINNQLANLTFKYDGVLENVSQDIVYNICAQEAVDSVLSGYNATIICYGQTGAGKTFTMSGDAHNYAHRGVIPRALHHVFREIDLRTDRLYKVHVSYMEIYNEALYDLLSDKPAASDSLSVLDDASNTVVRGLTKVEVHNEEEALSHFFLGSQGRSTAVNVLNSNSSRSHLLFSLYVEMRTSAEASERALISKLHLVDLAGSERTKKTNASGEQLREASCINKSLTFLEQVVNALARKDTHVPFRQSKLTAALRDALGGNCKTVMIANLWPEAMHVDECVSTLRFASRARCLETEAVVNESDDPGLALHKAERQIRELKQELAMRDMLSGRGRVVYEDLSAGEQLELQHLVTRYLSGTAELDELPVDSLKHIRETYKAFRVVAGAWATAAATGHAGPQQNAASLSGGQGSMLDSDAGGVGDVDTSQGAGFCIGTAPQQARPAASAGAPGHSGGSTGSFASTPRAPGHQQHGQQQQKQQPFGQPADQQVLGFSAGGVSGGVDRNAWFSKYKHSIPQGRRQSDILKQQQQQVAELKQQIKGVGAQVNSSKAQIDTLNAQLEAKKASASAAACHSTGGSTVLDDEEYQLMQQLKAAKVKYRVAFDSLKLLRSGLEPVIDSLAAAKEALITGFDEWWSSQGLVAGSGAGNHQQQQQGQVGRVRGKICMSVMQVTVGDRLSHLHGLTGSG